jgi:hypothetical protein
MSIKKKTRKNKTPSETFIKIAQLAFFIERSKPQYKGKEHRLMEDMMNNLLNFFRQENPKAYDMLRFLVLEKLDEQWTFDIIGKKPN